MKILKELRGDLSQQKVADDIGINQRTLCNYEKGYRQPDNEMLIKLADYYGVTVDYLLGRTEERKW